jgi:hypothetical protein
MTLLCTTKKLVTDEGSLWPIHNTPVHILISMMQNSQLFLSKTLHRIMTFPKKARSEVFMADSIKTSVFWKVTPCSPIESYQQFK